MHIDHYLSMTQKHSEQPDQSFTIAKEWSQGRTVYGGLSPGMLYCAAKSYTDEKRVLRSMSTNFVSPLLPEEAFTISIEIVRSGKNVSQI
ncbi:MAG: acyl-CoA thioesterase [Alphaproteobacteria bacterium]|jgi:acyl-CoA thioesterase